MMERMTMAKQETTMLFARSVRALRGAWEGYDYHDHAFMADTTGFMMAVGRGGRFKCRCFARG
jgi:hypothetical protein